MKKLFLASIALVALNAGGSALAADLPVKARPLPPPPAFSWTGFYIGAHLGAGWARSRWQDLDPFCTFGDIRCLDTGDTLGAHTPIGVLAGGQVGANWQIGAVVLGLEAQFSWADLKGEHQHTNFDDFTNNTDGIDPPGSRLLFTNSSSREVNISTRTKYLGTIAARFGITSDLMDRTLFYFKAGAGFARKDYQLGSVLSILETCEGLDNVETNCAVRASSETFTAAGGISKTLWGPMVGIGAELGLAAGWSVKAEYNYLWFGRRDIDIPVTAQRCVTVNGFDEGCESIVGDPRQPAVRRFSIDESLHVIKLGLNYRFDWGKYPVAARY
jgi:outer membrane immunogenic protein